jgi:hypothetical protein
MRVSFVGSAMFMHASYRYRTLMPARALQEAKVECAIVTSYDGLNADVFVFSKHWTPDKDRAAIEQIKTPGFMAGNQIAVVAEDRPDPKVVFDVCDDHFDHPQLGDHYRWMCTHADLVVASTDRMRKIILEKVAWNAPSPEVVVINDAYEFPELAPRHRWEQWTPENVLWYGHPTNFEHLHRVWNQLKGYNLMVITNGIELTDTVAGKDFPVVPWNHENMMDGFKQSDIVVIPTGDEGYKSHKGANRMLEAIRQGVFVVAEPHPEYNKFKEWMYIGDIGKGLAWVQSNKKYIKGRIESAQKFVSSNYHPQIIGKKWIKALSSIWGAESNDGPDGPTSMASVEAEQTATISPGI